ncbi:SusC/RagA family TonB-linked outer membrane protein [Pedobacter sp. P351]|uniref:SusC/RagA family TonB-linked outer membrane protein n=1 Tax=Pedobacter superstes TaxID=3133441 RepID=UPI0030A1B81F
MNYRLHKQDNLNRCAKCVFVFLLTGLTLVNFSAAFADPTKEQSAEKAALKARENITGTVKDEKGEPLPGVTVKIKGTTTATTTDVNGVYRINLPTGNETLVFSFIGFKSKEVQVGTQTVVNVVLSEDAASLEEVVINVGYGTKKKSEHLGSSATVNPQDLQDIPGPNLAAALRGRVAGVSVNEVSGRPGAGITLNVRNSTTTSNTNAIGTTNEPLYIIDGISMPNSEAFNNLDASMVESMTILKDASAAIYGAAGAKGVVLITTKRGQVGKPSINYNGYIGVSDNAKKADMLSPFELAQILNEGARIGNRPSSDLFSTADFEYLQNYQGKSWYDQLWSASMMQRHNLSVSGGSDKLTFFAGGSFQNENGNYEGIKADKYTFRSGMNATILPGLKADLAFNVDHNVNKQKNNGSDQDQIFYERIIATPAWVPLTISGLPVDYGSGQVNPLALLNSGYYDNRYRTGYRVNASLSYAPEFVKGLTAKLQISQGSTSNKSRSYAPPYQVYNFEQFGNDNRYYSDVPVSSRYYLDASNARTTADQGSGNNYQGFFTLQYGRTIAAHTFNVLLGGEQTENYNETHSQIWINQLVPGVEDPWGFSNNNIPVPNRQVFETTKRSFFSRISYDFNKKYLIEGVTRLDASSNFARSSRWGISPNIGLGWIVSNENFFKDNIRFINFLKLKANWGITGEDRVAQRLWQERYVVGLNDGYLFGADNNGIGLNPNVLPNPNITWEKKRTMNVGLETSMFNNKLDFGVEVFQNYVYDGFDGGVDRIYPMFAGFNSAIVNYREAYNWGSEFTIGYKAKVARELNLNTSINFSFGNSVEARTFYNPADLRFNRGEDIITVGLDPRYYSSSNIGLIAKGILRTQEEVDAFISANPNYLVGSGGSRTSPQVGWLVYEDVSQDGVIDENDMVPMFKNPQPWLSSGINLSLGYKSLNLSTNIAARFGGKVFYDSRARVNPTDGKNVLSIWRDRWTPENPMSGMMPRFDDPTLTRNSTFWAVDGTMIRVNNMTLSYKLPERLLKASGLGSARLLATGNNLWNIINPLPYKDPYTSSAYNYPTIRTISLGLTVGF